MFETLKRLYSENKVTSQKLAKAVEKGWITNEQKLQIEV